jgi:hypothetical protein
MTFEEEAETKIASVTVSKLLILDDLELVGTAGFEPTTSTV